MKSLLIIFLFINFSLLAKKDNMGIKSHNKTMKELTHIMKSKSKEVKRCSDLIRKQCGDDETKECAQKIVSKLPNYCKQMIGGFAQVSNEMKGSLSACTSVALKKCQMVDSIGEKKGSVAYMQRCLENAMKRDRHCVETLKQKVNQAAGSNASSSEVYKEFIR